MVRPRHATHDSTRLLGCQADRTLVRCVAMLVTSLSWLRSIPSRPLDAVVRVTSRSRMDDAGAPRLSQSPKQPPDSPQDAPPARRVDRVSTGIPVYLRRLANWGTAVP